MTPRCFVSGLSEQELHFSRPLAAGGVADATTGPGPAEDRDAEAYLANLTIARNYADGARDEHAAALYTKVLAVPVAATSIRGVVPPGTRCDDPMLTANSTRGIAVELGRTVDVPLSPDL